MKLIKPSYEIMSNIDADSILKFLEAAGRTCYKSEDKITPDSARELITKILDMENQSFLKESM